MSIIPGPDKEYDELYAGICLPNVSIIPAPAKE